MPGTPTAADTAAIEGIVQGMESAWNRGDGPGFAKDFAEDADFVNIFGLHALGRDTIAQGHSMIFSTVYAGSKLTCKLATLRMIDDRVALAHLQSELSVPHGPMAGLMQSVPSMVLVRDGGSWKIASFHNTLVKTPPGAPPRP